MTYRHPGIRLTQEFAKLLPALAPFNLPNVTVGPVFQVITDDVLGTYSGALNSFVYASLLPGAIIDVAPLDENELADHQFPITAKLVDASIELLSGSAGEIEAESLVTIKDATANAFADVKVGDKIEVLSGNNAGVYNVREIVDINTIQTQQEFVEAESAISYRVLTVIDEIVLGRDVDFEADDQAVDVFASLQYDNKDIVSGQVVVSYRALRVDFASEVKEYSGIIDLQAAFGIDQIVPANPLAFGLSLALMNTVTKVNGLGLGALALTNETQAYQLALDVLKRTSMYAIAPLTQNPVVHQLFATHVQQMSSPERGKTRVAICNKKMVTVETVLDTETTSGERTIINTSTDGVVSLGDSTLSYLTPLFGNVQEGDIVTIVGGTGVTSGDFVVESVDSTTKITLGDGFIASYNGSNVQFYVSRGYGMEANGTVFYDGNAHFLEDGVAAGNFLVIHNGVFAGRHSILAVTSNNKLTVAQIPGIVSVQSPITYDVEKDMSKTEIAEYHKGYASSFANRRVVMIFPDIVKVPEGSVLRELPAFYLSCAVAALTTGLPTHQGFTNTTVSGFLGFIHGSDYFDEDQLDIIADGGNMIFDQEVPEAPLYIRHELTTDRSSVKFQEYMVTKNVDYICKFLTTAFKKYSGQYNVIDATFDELKTSTKAATDYLKTQTVLPRIGGVIKSGSLVGLSEGINIDSIAMRFKLDIPIPLNNLDITVQV